MSLSVNEAAVWFGLAVTNKLFVKHVMSPFIPSFVA